MGDFMRDDYKEQISALVDDELRPEESRFLVARVGEDEQACEQFANYVTIRHALQGSIAKAPDNDPRHLAKRVAVALEDEPAHTGAQGRRRWQRWAQPAAGLALAASVAAVTLAIWPTQNPTSSGQRGDAWRDSVASGPNDSGAQPVADAGSSGAQLRTADVSGAQSGSIGPEMRQRLKSYMINHSEHSARGGIGGVMTYVRIAGHEADE
jgi:negative regulator of sigma E activity